MPSRLLPLICVQPMHQPRLRACSPLLWAKMDATESLANQYTPQNELPSELQELRISFSEQVHIVICSSPLTSLFRHNLHPPTNLPQSPPMPPLGLLLAWSQSNYHMLGLSQGLKTLTLLPPSPEDKATRCELTSSLPSSESPQMMSTVKPIIGCMQWNIHDPTVIPPVSMQVHWSFLSVFLPLNGMLSEAAISQFIMISK